MHCEKNFPLRKQQSDLDVGLDCGLNDEQYLNTVQDYLPWLLDSFRPDLILYDAGVDPHRDDALGKLCLTDRSTTSAAPVALDSYNRCNQPQQIPRTKPPAPELKETAVELQPSNPAKDGNVWEVRPTRKDDNIPFLPVNRHRILQWMEEGEQAQRSPSRESKPHRHHSPSARTSARSRQSTAGSIRQPEKSSSRHLPNQPIASDPKT